MKRFILLVLMATRLSAFAAPEGFEELRPVGDWVRPHLKTNQWKYSEPLVAPYGWYLMMPSSRDGEYRIVTENPYAGKNCIFLKGSILMDSSLFKWQASDDLALVRLWARSDRPNATISFSANLQNVSGGIIGRKVASCEVTPEWKEYLLKVEVPAEFENQKVAKVAPSIASGEGAFFDDVEFFAGNSAAMGSKEIPDGTVLMDFCFKNCGGKDKITDNTGNYTLYSDCGKLLEEHNALRIAFGSRFRIPCENDAFGERFTILVSLAKAENLGRDFRSPILSRGFMQPYAGSQPGPDKFDFAFDLNAYVPGFYYIGGGIRTSGVPYNQDFRFSRHEHGKADPKKLFLYDTFQHIAAVYDHGAVKLYLNGTMIAENPEKIMRKLLNSNQDIYLGAFRVENEEDNQIASEMLVESLKIVAGALSEEAIQAAAVSVAQQRAEKIRLTSTRNYYSKEMLPNDPNMENRLRQTRKYLDSIRTNPFAGNDAMSARFSGSARQLRLLINGKPEAPITANPHFYERREHMHNEFIADFAAAGVNLIRVGGLVDDFWKGEGEYDWSKIEARLKKFIEINPAARITVGLGSTPPKWFYNKYPEELEEYYVDWRQPALGRKKWTGHGGPMGSDKWLELSTKMIGDFIRHMESSPYKNHIYGYSVSGGDAGEWYWPGQFAGLTGYSTPTRNSFRNWLKKRYKTDEALQKSWHDSSITFDTVEIPDPQDRFNTENGLFRDPEKAARIADFRRFINDRTLHNFNESCRAVRENASSDKIVTTYYGYPMYYAGRGVLHVSGLQTVSDVFKSPYIDAIATPIDYLKRRGGEPGINIAGFTGSAQLATKMIWREEDLRTHLYPRLEFGRTATLKETMEVIRRAYGYTLGENYGMWFVCQAGMHAYHQDEMMEDVKRLQKIAAEAATIDRIDTAEVALVFDEKESLTNLAATASEFVIDHIWGTYQKMHSAGIPFKVYFLDDLANSEMPDFKLYVFVNPWAVSDEQRDMIHKKLKRNKATALWNYAPGYLNNAGFNPRAMAKLTGIELKELRDRSTLQATAAAESLLARNAGSDRAYFFGPLFFAEASSGIIPLAKNNNNITAAVKKDHGFTSVWTLLPPARAFLTDLAEEAGVHVYSRDGAMLLANDAYVVLHGEKAGKHTVTLPKTADVTEMISGRKFGTTRIIEDNLEYPGATRIYKIK